jgi:hypothetical protein
MGDITPTTFRLDNVLENEQGNALIGSASSILTSTRRVIMTGGQLLLSEMEASILMDYKYNKSLTIETKTSIKDDMY